jgi:hypothetical protein
MYNISLIGFVTMNPSLYNEYILIKIYNKNFERSDNHTDVLRRPLVTRVRNSSGRSAWRHNLGSIDLNRYLNCGTELDH